MKGKLALTAELKPFGKAVLRAEGSVDLATTKQFEAAFRELEDKGVKYVVVDMARLEYMSSSGFGLLIRSKTEYAKSQGDVVFVRPQPAIMSILQVLGLTDFFRIASSVEEALLPPPPRS